MPSCTVIVQSKIKGPDHQLGAVYVVGRKSLEVIDQILRQYLPTVDNASPFHRIGQSIGSGVGVEASLNLEGDHLNSTAAYR